MTHELIALTFVCVIHLVLIRWSQGLLTRDIGSKAMPALVMEIWVWHRTHCACAVLWPTIPRISVCSLPPWSSSHNPIKAHGSQPPAPIPMSPRALYVPAYRYGWAP